MHTFIVKNPDFIRRGMAKKLFCLDWYLSNIVLNKLYGNVLSLLINTDRYLVNIIFQNIRNKEDKITIVYILINLETYLVTGMLSPPPPHISQTLSLRAKWFKKIVFTNQVKCGFLQPTEKLSPK